MALSGRQVFRMDENAGGQEMVAYGFRKQLDASFEQVVEQVTARLKDQGFGVLTTIDVRGKFKEKLGEWHCREF